MELSMFASLPLTALRAFESASRLLSFKAAAEELSVTPTAVSHQIRSLETWLGCSTACTVPCWKWRKVSTPCARNAAARA
jgi:hypothetical protein